MSGSTMLMALSNTGQMSGSVPVLAASTASFVQNAQSASYVLTAQTASFTALAQSASNAVAAATASFVALAQSASNAVSAQTASFANTFTVNSTLTAQTLVVQTITSSVDFVTGSTRFGSLLGNTHVFTGSVSVTGSSTFNGALTAGGPLTIQAGTGLTKHYFTAAGSGDALNQLYDNTGTVKIQLYTNGDSYLSGGKVGIGTATPQAFLHIAGQNGTNALTIGASNNYEIFITGSDSANIYHASPNQAIYLNTNGGPLHLGTSNASTLLTITGSNVGIGVTNPYVKLDVRGGGIGQTTTDFVPSSAGSVIYMRTGATTGNTTYGVIQVGNTGDTAGGNLVLNQFGGNVGINTTNPLGTLSTIGGAVQIMGDYQNHQTIIKSAGAGGTFNGALTITIPEMSNASIDGYGGYSCEVYVAGYQGLYCHAWFSGYINGGIVVSETTILRSSGGWSISQSQYGTYGQGFQFTIDYPSGIIHPAARIIFNKGGSPNSTAYPANSITAVFS